MKRVPDERLRTIIKSGWHSGEQKALAKELLLLRSVERATRNGYDGWLPMQDDHETRVKFAGLMGTLARELAALDAEFGEAE